MGGVALEVPLSGLPVRGLVQGHDAGAAGVEPLGEPLDRAALPGRVPALADHHDPLTGFSDPALKLEQFDLQDPLGPLVLLTSDFAVVGVILPPGSDRSAVGIKQHRLLRAAGIHTQPREQVLGVLCRLLGFHARRLPS